MAAVTQLGATTFDTNSGTKTVVATPAVRDLIVLVVAHTGNTATTAPTDNNPDGAGSYSLLDTAVTTSSADTMKMWVRDQLIGNAASTTFSTAPGTTTGGGLAVMKVTGMSRSSANAKRQSAIQSNQAAAGTPTATLGAAALTGNCLIGAVFNATNPATITPRISPAWTEATDVGFATPTTGLEVSSIDSGETGSSIAWGAVSASAFCDIVVELDTSVPAPPQANSFSTSGQQPSALVALGAAFLGSATIWGMQQLQPQSPQPVPTVSQYEFAARNFTQPQPVFSKRVFPAVSVTTQPNSTFFAAPQANPDQLQPQIWKQQLDLVAVSSGQGTFSPQQTEPDRQPQYWRGIFASVAQTPTPNRTFFASPQSDPSQLQPRFDHQQLTSLAQFVPAETVYASPQADTSQIQPQVWTQYLLSAKPIPTQFRAGPQADPTQIQPVFTTQQPPSQATQQPPWGPFFASPQADPTQIQPVFFQIAFLPSVTPPPVVAIDTGGGAARRKYKKRYQLEVDGQVFEVRSEQEAISLLERLKSLAEERVTQVVRRSFDNVEKPIRRPKRKILADARRALVQPDITSVRWISQEALNLSAEIDKIYKEALKTIEIGVLMRIKDEEDEEETIIFLI